MRAIIMTQHGGPEVLQAQELPDPVPGAGEVLIRVRAFGLNHADTYMRSGVWSFGIPVLGLIFGIALRLSAHWETKRFDAIKRRAESEPHVLAR